MEVFEQVREQFFGSLAAAAIFAFLVLYWRKNREYHWPTTWFDIALVIGLTLLALLPNGWNWLFAEPVQAYFQAEPEASHKALLITDVVATLIGAALGAFGASRSSGKF